MSAPAPAAEATRTRRARAIHLPLWLGLALILIGVVSYFGYFVRFPSLRDFPWVNLPVTAAGVLLTLWGLVGAWRSGPGVARRLVASGAAALGLLFAALFVVYLFDLTRLPRASEFVTGMSVAPDFELRDQNGHALRLSDLRGRKVVLSFYRGHW